MSKLKSFMVPMMAIAAVASAVPAVASAQQYRPAPQYSQQAPGLQVYAARKDALERRIDRAVGMRRLDVRQARDLKQDLRDISRMERDFVRGGLSRQERQQLDRRYDRVEAKIDREIRIERRDDRRDDRRHR